LKDRFVAETPIRVRYAETDAMGVTHHSTYIVYFEEGRSDYARQRGYPYGEVEKAGYLLMVTEVKVRYARPSHYEQALILRTWIDEMRSRGLTFAYEIVDAVTGDCLVTGTSKHICVTKNGDVAHIPEEWRAWG
jgi:acyl-CoA thioester hydrolase